MARRFVPPKFCPICGEPVPPKALACPECGADERTGWDREKTYLDGVDLPDDSFDYDGFLKDEGFEPRIVPKGISVGWWIVGVIVLVLFVYMVFSPYLWW